jgi:hypothetical protein
LEKSVWNSNTVRFEPASWDIDVLKSKEAYIVHSLANQLTYVKGPRRNAQISSEGISNISAIVKKELVKSHDRYVQLT